MLIAENDLPFLKGEYPVDIQGREYEVVGLLKSQGHAPFCMVHTDKPVLISADIQSIVNIPQ